MPMKQNYECDFQYCNITNVNNANPTVLTKPGYYLSLKSRSSRKRPTYDGRLLAGL
jgi:hypothetical protein